MFLLGDWKVSPVFDGAGLIFALHSSYRTYVGGTQVEYYRAGSTAQQYRLNGDQALQALPTEFLADTGREDNGAAESENYWDVRF